MHEWNTKRGDISAESLIGIIYGSVAAVLLIIGIVIFMLRRKSKEILSKSNTYGGSRDSSSDLRKNQTERIDMKMQELTINEDDNWI